MKKSIRAMSVAVAGVSIIAMGTQAFAQTAASPYTDSDRAAMNHYQAYSDLTTGSIQRAPTLGRFTKTPDGNFNSTRSLEEGTSSGDGSGPFGGSPNGG
ncbi:hypothetical protein [Beijerinckia sp. L45]|uniref:hypothetical protein n=1 Tax=Beijerinckia sp. L45 TaxID=1641855 RepID=UPI00131B1BE6|nr:hypothetical protein [Beijerinckia sp. L45]